jgi:Kef-type K+ transport system membrane component KefB
MLFRTLARALSEDNGLGGAVVTHESVVATALERFLVQLLMICLLCEVMGRLLAYVGQPRVIAEILAGIFLGPTVLGQAPGFELFSEGVETLTLVGELGLLLFLFLMGLELDLGLVKSQFRRSAAISLGGETLAFLLSYPTAMILHSGVPGLSETSLSELFLFIGVANSVTAFPVLSRIMNENNLLGTKVGTTVIASAAVDDIVAWTLLALVVSITSGGSKEESDAGSNADAAYILMMVIGFAIFMFVAVRPVLRLAIHRLDGKPSESEAQPPCQRTVALCLMLTIAASWTTAVLGSSAIFGAFITGLVLPRDNPHLAIGLMEKLEDLISVLLLPVFFAVSGLSTDFTQLNTAKAWGYAFMVLAVACAGKIVGCGSVARIQGFSKRESLAVGFLMNTVSKLWIVGGRVLPVATLLASTSCS